MSAQAPALNLSVMPARRSLALPRHRLHVWLAVAATLALTVFLAGYGFDYYWLAPAQRALSAKHALLRSSGPVGRALGVLGGTMFLLVFLYPLGKRWRWLGRLGQPRHWLDFHMLLGLAAPVLITFHCCFKLGGIVGVAYWFMLSVTASGLIGRYLHGQIPRRLDEAQTSLREVERLVAQSSLSAGELAPLLRLPGLAEVAAMPAVRVLWLLLYLDVRRWFLLWTLRCRRHACFSAGEELRAALAAARKQAALSKTVLFLSQTQRFFRLWHVVHRPFAYSFAAIAMLHMAVVLLLGF